MFADQSQQGEPTGGEGDPQSPTVITLEEPRAPIFAKVLEYIYTGSITLSESTIVEILGTAIDYQLQDLIQLCLNYIYDTVNAKNACEFLQAARTYKQVELESKMFAYVEQHAIAVLKSKGFVELEESSVISLLKSDSLMCTEYDILTAVKEWGTVNSVISGQTIAESLKDVILHVRLPMLAAEELKIAEEENEKIGYVPVSMLAAAWKFHALKASDSGPQTTPRAGYA